ncbi:MAG: V-type ATP synthase subunit I [Oscillospiraceae bacterium]|nr:V-type ATP synthase subunit I [Oscillospiraceae bacterium]
MAIVKMEKLVFIFKTKYLDEVLHLMQGFQGIHIESNYDSTIPPSKKVEVDKYIRETEKNLQDINAAYAILKERKSTNILNLFKNSEEKKLNISELTKIVEESNWSKILEEVIQTDRQLQNNRTKRQEVTKFSDKLKIWEPLKCNPLDFKRFHRTTALFGSVHKKHVEDFTENIIRYEEEGMCYDMVTENEDRVYFLLLCHSSMNEKLNTIINEFSFSVTEYPFDKPQADVKHELETEDARLIEEEAEIGKLIIEQSKYDEILAFAEDYNLNALLRHKKSLEITYDGDNIEIDGWIIADKREQFKKLLEEHIPGEDYRMFFLPVKDKEIDEVPIKLKNNKLVSVYENLTEMYSLPKYNEIDPTPVMTIFYLIFFGLMVADIGYGLAIFLIGLFVKRFLKVKRNVKKMVNFLFYLSFPIIGWGIIFGNICGIQLSFALIHIPLDIFPLIILSVIFGFFHIMSGLIMQMINQVKLKNYADMLTGGTSWFLIFLGIAVMILAKMTPWFEIDILFYIGLAVTLIGVGMVVVVPAVQYGKRWYAGFGKGLYALYGALGYIGDFVSYTRLMALAVAGGSVAMAFNTILDFLPLPVKFTLGIVLAVILHGINILLSMLSAYVHGIRLEFIEFFGKFYTGGGKKFEPFKAAEKNVIISDTENDKKELL